MSYQRQPELNGAYYGPSIPPPTKGYHRPGKRARDGCCCPCCCLFDCLVDCGCCLLSCVFKIIFSILIFIALILLAIYFIVRPHQVKFHATDATLTTFNLSTTNNNLLNYNLAVNFSVRNPNRKIGIYYDKIEANGIYSGQRFSTVNAETFYQGHKNTTSFGPVVFKGQQNLVGLKGSDFEKETNDDEFYNIEVKLYLRVRFKVLGWYKTGTYKPKVRCDLKVPLKGGKSSQQFEPTRCHYSL